MGLHAGFAAGSGDFVPDGTGLRGAGLGGAGAYGAGLGGAVAILDGVLRRTEDSFLTAGIELVAAVDVLRRVGAVFDRLTLTFGAETGDRLMALIVATRGHVGQMQGGFDRFLQASDAVRQAVRGVRLHVDDLDRVVRTIANVSVNARIQGNGLVPPRPQVTAFISRLAGMAAEAEAILAELREAMAGIGVEMAEMDAVTQDLRDELGQRVLPALGRFQRVAQGVLDRQGATAATNAALASRMEAVNAEVSRLVIGLQSGDATRQRLERVRETLGACHGPLEGPLVALAVALADAAVAAARSDIAGTVKSAEAVRLAAEQAVGQARAFYVRPSALPGPAGEQDGGGFALRVEAMRAKLDLMRARAAGLRGRLETILRHEAALRQIGHQVRLSGLNAVLICAKLGDDGRALRELAQWLRTLTDESDAIVIELQAVLDRTAGLADRLGGESIAGFDAALHDFFADSAALATVIAGIGQDRAAAAQVFDEAGHTLPQHLGHAATALTRFQHLLGDMQAFDAVLVAHGDNLDPLPDLDAEGDAVLAALRKRYTMQSERDLHDSVLRGLVAGAQGDVVSAATSAVAEPTGAASAPASAPAPAQDDTDDIFF